MTDTKDSSPPTSVGWRDLSRRPPSPTVRREIEVILARQLASSLAVPVVIIDPAHVVVYYNEPAEHMVGRRYDEEGAVPWEEWSRVFAFSDEEGGRLDAGEMPLARAVETRRPEHRRFWMRGLDGVDRHMEEIAVPLRCEPDRFLGAMGIFMPVEQ